MSGAAGGTRGRAPHSTPTYSRPRPLASGHGCSNPGLDGDSTQPRETRLELAATTLSVEYENLSSAISRIRDVDVAKESTQLAKYNILVQSGTSMLAQANQSPQSVLKLLQS